MEDNALPELDPRYIPAEKDLVIMLRFVGNTPMIGGFRWDREISPFHLWAAAAWLKDQADFMQQQMRIRQMSNDIVVPPPGTKMPPPPAGG